MLYYELGTKVEAMQMAAVSSCVFALFVLELLLVLSLVALLS